MDHGIVDGIGTVAAALVGLYTAIQLFFIWKAVRSRPAGAPPSFDELPMVSVLVPARNEAHTIRRCLECLSRLDYPIEKIEILIGDDASTDGTAEVVRDFIKGKPQFRLISVGPPRGNARAKANALVYLTEAAQGEFYFITDADMCVPPSWITALLGAFAGSDKVGIVSGATVIEGATCPVQWQSLEWLYFLSLLRFLPAADVTAIGNNMAVRKAAYWSVGGYERIPFSVTEDLALYHALRRKGWQHRFVFEASALGWTLPLPWGALLRQRHRWLQGVKQLTLRIQALFAVKALYPLAVAGLALGWWEAAAAMWLFNYLLQAAYLRITANRLGVAYRPACRWTFEFYQYAMNAVMGMLFFLPLPVRWKYRTFH